MAANSFAGWAAAGDTGAPLYTSKPRFRIPFQFDSAEMRRLGAVEIQLSVSTDQGLNWTENQSVEPSAGKFSFEAPADGEYWFAVQTIDGEGRHFPEGALAPGLKVVVDTAAPTMGLVVEPLGRDRVSLSWDIIEQNLDLGTLKIEWREDGFDWQPLSILSAPSGQTSWSTRGRVEVRGSVSDLAGNAAEASDDSGAESEPFPEPLATPDSRRGAPSVPDEQPDFSKPVAEFPVPQPTAEFQTAEAPTEADRDDDLPIVRSMDPSSYYRQRVPSRRMVNTGMETKPPRSNENWAAAPTGAEQGSVKRWTASGGPASRPHRSVRTRSFKIGYQVDDVGPSGVAQVDLYITEDNGRKWFHYGDDPDRASPFEVVVPADGEYGFAIRVQSGVGVAQQPPQPGHLPETYVLVGRAPPIAQILPLRQGSGADHNQILIEWSLSDERLDSEPVSLYYSEGPDGPWQPITGWTKNSGRYVWTITERVRKQLYVKMEARDAAGNLTEAQAGHPVLVDLSQPTARIVDVESEVRSRPK